MPQNQIESTGKSVEEAIQQGLKQLGVTREDVEVSVLQVESPRLFGLFGKSPAKVRLTLHEDDKSCAYRLTRDILDKMGVDAQITVQEVDGQIMLDIPQGGGDVLIGQRGKTLDALQYLVSRIVNNGRKDEEWTRISIDVEGYRERRMDTLRALAQRMARQAVEQGREVTTEPMTPHDRRVIHMTLKPSRDVETFSRGHGDMRRVVICPRKKADDSRDRDRDPRRGGRGGHDGGGRGNPRHNDRRRRSGPGPSSSPQGQGGVSR